MASHAPSASSIRFDEAVIAEARPSNATSANRRGSLLSMMTTSTGRRAWGPPSASAAARPLSAAPITAISVLVSTSLSPGFRNTWDRAGALRRGRMGRGLETLLETLDLDPLEVNLFRGSSPKVGWQRVFGGQVVAQALRAAQRTVEPERGIHSLHGYFIRPGDPEIPIIYEVARDRDGRSFTTRRVIAIQHG